MEKFQRSKVTEQLRYALIDKLTPYWEVKDKILSTLNQSQTEAYKRYREFVNAGYTNEMLKVRGLGALVNFVSQVDGRIASVRKAMRQQDPQLDYAVSVWY